MTEIPTGEVEALVTLGQISWDYIMNNLVVAIMDGVTYACSVMPATEEVRCFTVDIISVEAPEGF